ncbi:MAG: signal peptidase I [Desulfotalea sp.]
MRLAVSEKVKVKSVIREYAEAFIVAIVLALFIRTFVVQAFKIPSGSMLPTLQIGDHLLVNKFIYGIKIPFTGKVLVPISDPERGDIVVFKYPQDPSIDYIKRVIGIGGDKIEIKNKVIYLNDQKMNDPNGYLSDSPLYPKGENPRDNLGPIIVPEHKIFVMGDNRDNSYDSRFWGFVDQTAVRGEAFILYWSWDIKKPLLSVDRWTSIKWSRIANIVD